MSYGNRQYNPYSSPQYQPLASYQNQTYQNPNQNATASNTYGYQRYVGEGSTDSYPPRDLQGSHSNGRSSIDTTNLGNLAYASTLETQRQDSYQGAASYSTQNSASTIQEQQRRGSGTATWDEKSHNSRPSLPSHLAYSHDSTRSTSTYSPQYSTNTDVQSPQYQSAASQPMYRPSDTIQTSYQPARPLSGQSVQRPGSGAAHSNTSLPPSHSVHSLLSGSRTPHAHEADRGSAPQALNTSYNFPYQTPSSRTQTHALSSARPSSSSSSANQKQNPNHRGQSPLSSSQRNPETSALNKPTSQISHKSRRSEVALPSMNERNDSVLEPPERPTTVDPNQVFNHQEYQKRQEADLARKRATESANTARKVSNSDSQRGKQMLNEINTSAAAADKSQKSKSTNQGPADSEVAIKDQMEIEMKQMLDKMREYKAKDPSLFSQIWEQVKKGQTAPSTLSHSPSLEIATTLAIAQNQLPSPVVQTLSADVELEAPFPPGFDRGRFPFQRRRRGGSKISSQRSPQPEESSTVSTAQSMEIERPSSTDQKLFAAMKTFQQISNSSQPPSSAQGPGVNPWGDSQPTAPDSQNKAPPDSQARQPARATIGKTVWPESKKRALADAAANLLSTQLSVEGRAITSGEIQDLLDQNPSYAQLCEHLESKGFSLDKSQFARYLLSAVPDLTKPQTTASFGGEQTQVRGTKVNGALSENGRSLHTADKRNSLPAQDGRFVDPASLSIQRIQGPGSVQQPLESPLIPLTKQDRARKRTFGEIIDLSQDQSDNEGASIGPEGRFNGAPQSYSSLIKSESGQHTVRDSTQKSAASQNTSVSSRDHVRSEVVVQPLNKRRDALRRSDYDAMTIARDILVSSGKHPGMVPLNHHLDILRDRFESVNFESDLGTLRWDIIDPGKMVEHEDQKDRKTEGKDQHEKRSDDKTNPADTPRRRGRPPRAEITPLKQAVSVSVPSNNIFSSPAQTLQQQASETSALVPMEFSRDEDPRAGSESKPSLPDTPAAGSALIQSFSYSQLGTNKRESSHLAQSSSPNTFPKNDRVPGRRGRPPGAKNRQPRSDKGIPKSRPPSYNQAGQRVQNGQLSGSATQKNAASPVNGVAIMVPSRSPSISHGADETRLPKLAGPNTSLPSTSYTAYKCGWQACPAELHDLDTLRKHVRKHRTRLEKPYQCRWQNCGAGDSGGYPLRMTFPDTDSWDSHLENEHIRPLVQSTGQHIPSGFRAVNVPYEAV